MRLIRFMGLHLCVALYFQITISTIPFKKYKINVKGYKQSQIAVLENLLNLQHAKIQTVIELAATRNRDFLLIKTSGTPFNKHSTELEP